MLPSGYKQIEYVESNGTGSYFKTGVIPVANTRVIFDGYVVSGDTALYGSRYAVGNNAYTIQYIGSNRYRLSYDNVESLVSPSYSKGTRYTFDQRANELYINDVLVASVTANPTYPNAREIYAVGTLNTNGTASNFGVVRMYSMKIYQNDVLVGDFVPVEDAGGVIGIYNLVTDTLFRNAGSGSVSGGGVVKSITGIAVTTPPSKVTYQQGETLDLTGMVVTATYDDGSTEVVDGYSVDGYDSNASGEQTLTVTYRGHTATFTVTVGGAGVRTYTLGENVVGALDLGTWVLTVSGSGNMENFTDGNSPAHTDEYFKETKEIIILTGVTDIGNYTFSHCSNLTNIIIPDSVTRIGHHAFNYCSILTSITIPDSITSIGQSTFSFCSSLTSITIPDSVTEIARYAFSRCSGLTNIVIPDSVTYIGESAFIYCDSLTSITILRRDVEIYTSSKVIPTGTTIYGYIGSTAEAYATRYERMFVPLDGTQTVTFLDWDGTVLSEQQVALGGAAEPPQNPTREGYTFVGWDKDFTGITGDLTVNAVYQINRYSVTFLDWDGTTLDTQEVEYLSGATAPQDPIREGYFFLGWDKDFSSVTDDLTVTAVYDPEATVTVSPMELNLFPGQTATISATLLPETLTQKEVSWGSSDPEIATFDPVTGIVSALAPGTTTITATHVSQGVTASCNVTVSADSVESIEIETNPTKTNYYAGETLDTSGLTVKVKYASGKEETISEGFTVSGYDGTTVGEKTITVVYSGKSATFNVTVQTDVVVSIEVTTPPDKVEYVVSQDLDLTGMVVTATYGSGKSEVVTEFTVSGFDSSSIGRKTVTVAFEGVTTTFTVDIIADRIVSIEITSLPTKTVYLVSQSLDLTGMVVMGTWVTGTVKEIEDYTVSGYSSSRIGQQTITVEYEGATDTFTVTVKEIVSLELASPPNKTQYFVGEYPDTTGMQVNALCEDGTVVDCTNDVFLSFTNDRIAESPAMTVQLLGRTLEVQIEVNKAYVGTPVAEDVILTYDFEKDLCTVDGTGASASIYNIVGTKYNERVKEIHISGISEVPTGYCASFPSLETAIIQAPMETLPTAMFNTAKKLSKVELPDTLVKIDSVCFHECTSLTEIALPDTLEEIGNTAFYRTGLRSITLPESVKTIGNSTFCDCLELANVELNNGLETINYNCFCGCKSLRVLLIPDTVTEINNAIADGLSLDYVKYPASMTVIGVPRGTDAKTIVIPEGVTEITSSAFSGCGRIEKVFLPDTLKIISNSAFWNCSALKSLAIPERVEILRYGAFEGCGLEELFFYGRNTVVDSTAYIPAGTVIHGYRGSSAEAYCQEFGNTFIPFDDYEFTDEIKTLYDTDSIRKRVVIHFPQGGANDIENDRIYSESMTLTESICDEENLVFGGCNASKFEIQVADVEEDIRGLEIEVKQYIEEKYVPIFTGIIDSADRQDNRRFKKIIAYDRMYTEGTQDLTSWLKSLTFPMTILDLRYKVCEKLGFTQTSTPLVNDYLTINKLSIQSGITGRDVLRAICEFNGVFGYVTRMGYFDYISLEKNDQPFSVSGYRKVKYEEYTVRGIESLSVRGSNGDTALTLGAGNRYVLRDNFIVYGMQAKVLQEAATNLLKKIQGIAYRSFSGNGRGLPYIFLGRHIQYTVNSSSPSRSAEVVDSYVLKRTMTGIQALKDTYSASGDEFQPDVPANVSTSETARQLEDYPTLDDLDMELDTRFEEFVQGDQYQIDIEAAVQNVLLNGGYYKIVSVPELPAEPAADTVYLIQGEVTVN